MRIMALFEWPIRRQCLDADAHADRVTMQRLAKIGWGMLIFSHVRRLGPFFGTSKFRISIIFDFFKKNEYFWVYDVFSLGIISLHFRAFS